MREIKIKLGNATYTVSLHKHRGCYGYTISRNKKVLSITTTPSFMKDQIKMHISEKIMQQAFYEVNHEIEKLKL